MEKKKERLKAVKSYFLAFVACALLLSADQFTKHLARIKLKGKESFVIWKGVFSLKYLENTGAAFGMLQGGRNILLAAAALILLLISVLYAKMPHTKRFSLLRICAVLVASGAAGNTLDRLRADSVTDFFYFEWIDFPIFNLADCYIVVAGVLFIFAVFFYYQDEELSCFSFHKRSK